MPLPVVRQAIDKFPGTRFINAFGQTETASTITMLPPDDHNLSGTADEVETKLRRLTSIGKPLDDVEVMIVTEDGDPVADGEVGEIVARGPRMMTGYWGQEDATRDTLKGGWLYTGGPGLAGRGRLYLPGRAGAGLHQAGRRNGLPEEVEMILAEHPGVADSAVIGVPDLEWGEEVKGGGSGVGPGGHRAGT